ncbi:MAG: inositol monophosphatase family protein [Planctomycetota bacterium]
MQTDELMRRAQTARDLATRAGVVARSMQRGIEAREKEDGSGPVTAADLASEEIILEGLRAEFPDDPIVSEESGESGTPGRGWVWCVDPLDGTREYAQGRDDFTVMVGLLYDGVPTVGAVGIPAEERTAWGALGVGVFVEDEPVQVEPLAALSDAVVVHSRSHRSDALNEILARLGPKETQGFGSAGYKAVRIVTGQAHLYIHPRHGTKWWDSVAPAALVLATGGTFADATMNPIVYEGDREHRNGLLFAAPGLEAPLRDSLTRP